MELGKRFEGDLKKHGLLGKHREVILDIVLKYANKFNDRELISNFTNIIKTSHVVGDTYDDFVANIRSSKIYPNLNLFNKTEFEKFSLASLCVYLINSGDSNIEPYVHIPRNIYEEVAQDKFFTTAVTANMIDLVKKAETPDSYSVQEPPVESWDEYYYKVCQRVASNSKCLSRRIGSVLVVDKSIVSTGYNGPPRGIPRCDERWIVDKNFNNKYGSNIKDRKKLIGQCPRRVLGFSSGKGLEICPAGHAERNSLINAAREGIKTKDGILYMTCNTPCSPCLVEIINAGISEIVITALGVYDENAEFILSNSKLKVRLFDFIKV